MSDAALSIFAIRIRPLAAMLTFYTHAQTDPTDYTELIHKQGVVLLAQPLPPLQGLGIVRTFTKYW